MIRLAKQEDNQARVYLSNGKKLQYKGKLINYTDSTVAIDENGKINVYDEDGKIVFSYPPKANTAEDDLSTILEVNNT